MVNLSHHGHCTVPLTYIWHGLWCQVNSASNAGMGSDIGDMFYPTGNGPDGFTVVPTSGTNNVPYPAIQMY